MVYKVFTDQESGGKATRTKFKALFLEAYQHKFDLVGFLRLDRFSWGGALTTLRYLKELKDQGINYKPFTEPYLDSLGPFGNVIVSMLAIIAAQDLIEISENTKAALAKKKAAGVQLGAPVKSTDIAQVRHLKASGASNQAIARALKMSPSMVIKTPMQEAGVADAPSVTDYLKSMIPMGRIGEPEEIAEALLFLASNRTSYITGHALPVEGGKLPFS